MKKIMRIFATIIMAIILIGFSISTVEATKIKFNPVPSTVSADDGETIIINLKIEDIDAGDMGINTFKSVFKYDEEVFEFIKVENKNNWEITYNDEKNNEQYGTLLAVLVEEGVKEEQEIGQITLKVKEGNKGKTGHITFTEIASNDGSSLILDEDKTIEINIKEDALNNIVENDISENRVNDDTLVGQVENIIKGILPQTGESGFFLFTCTILVILISFIIYINYRRGKQDK